MYFDSTLKTWILGFLSPIISCIAIIFELKCEGFALITRFLCLGLDSKLRYVLDLSLIIWSFEV